MSKTNSTAVAPRAEKLPVQRHLNGPQTSGRNYRNLSEPQYAMVCDQDVPVPMRDGVKLLVDVYRPDAEGRFPSLFAASCYPRQIQNLGAPMGFIEAGVSEFWASRGYVHVIANLRGTSGSEGTFTFFDAQERHDMYDLVEWIAAQPWCDGKVAGIGLSYFAGTQVEAAVERPPHLKAIFPLGLSHDFYEAARHHGLFSSSMMSPFLSNVGIMSDQGKDKLWRGKMINLLRHVLALPKIHDRFATFNGESAKALLQGLRHLNYETHPWDDIWRAMAVEHPVRDAWWDDRNTERMLADIDTPVYLGCDWENVPLHLPGTFRALKALGSNPNVRVVLLGKYGLTWPWESLHEEALAWFDHWLKGHDTGVLEGPRIRYWLPVAEEWRTADEWPPAESRLIELALRADGALARDEGQSGTRCYECLGTGLDRLPQTSDPPSSLSWETAPLAGDVDMAGNIELRLEASATASDTAWIATLQDVSPDGSLYEVTAGWLQASLREVDEPASEPGAPVLPCRRPQVVPVGEKILYRIPLVANARRFKTGHRVRILLSSDDQRKEIPAIMGFRHSPVGTSTLNTIHSSSRLLLPITSSATL